MKRSSPAVSEFPIGEKVPGTNWVVRNILGRGGMGVVLDVEKASGLRMAMKVVRPGFAQSEQFIARFLEEVRLLARLRHPNIVEVTDCDTLADGSPYIMMERLEGRTLREALSDKDLVLSAENVWNVLGQLCSALHCAHAAQPPVVHRDVKPGNVFLYDRRHFVASVKLIDFGISAALDEKRATGAPMGTARYMAPEACRGESPTPQVDIYALGLIAYEMLTRAWPWQLESHDAQATIDAHVNREPIPPSRRMPWIPKSVDACVLQALGKNPAHRQRDVLEFRKQLGELPFVDDGSGHHRSDGITAPTAETLAHGRGGPRELAERASFWGPETSSSASIYVSAVLEETSNEPSASASSSVARFPDAAAPAVRALSASSQGERGEHLDTPLSSASEPRLRRRRSARPMAAVAIGSVVVAASAAGYRAAHGHATVHVGPPLESLPAILVDTPVVGRPAQSDYDKGKAPTERGASQETGAPGVLEGLERADASTRPRPSPRESSGDSRPATPKTSVSKSDSLEMAPTQLEPMAKAPKTKRPLSDEELLFVPGTRK